MHAALSCREMIMANFNWHIPHLQQFAPLDVVQTSSREVWNALWWEDHVHQLASPVSHWLSHHNAVFYWETFGPAIHILPWDTAQLTMAVALPDHYSLWSQLLCKCVCVCVICKMEVVIMSWSLTHSWSQWILHKDCGQQIKDVASFS